MNTSIRRHVNFTIRPVGGGFTDKLFQFSTFYKLGLSLGFRYLHSPFESFRSSRTVYEFLGFHDYLLPRRRWDRLTQTIRLRTSRVVDIPLNDRILDQQGIGSLAELRDHVRDRVEAESGGLRQPVVRFSYRKGGRHFFKWIHSEYETYSDGLDLRSAYFRLGSGRTAESVFAPHTLNVLVHVRQGDTAIIETPWNTFIPLQGARAFQERNSFNPPGLERGIDVQEYHDFLESFRQHWRGEPLSFRVFSDGYRRGFRRLLARTDRAGLSRRQVAALRSSQKTYDQRKFAVFDGLSDCRCYVGEADEKLEKLVHAALTADVIVVGDQQMMIGKLLANYYDPERPPVIIALYNATNPPDFEKVSLTSRKARIFPVRVGDEAAIPPLVTAVQGAIAEQGTHTVSKARKGA